MALDGIYLSSPISFDIQSTTASSLSSSVPDIYCVILPPALPPLRSSLLQVLKGHDDHVITCLQFCGNRIVSGSDDNTLKVWSAVTGKVRANRLPKALFMHVPDLLW